MSEGKTDRRDGELRYFYSLRLMKKEGELSFISTVTVFGTPIDVTLSELAIESFFPADTATQKILHLTMGGTALK